MSSSGYEHEQFWDRFNDVRKLDQDYRAAIPAESSIYYPERDEEITLRAADYLESRGLSSDLARLHGWYGALYRGPRLIVPCVRTDSYNFWQGRLLENISKEQYCSDCQTDRGPNYQLCMDNHWCRHWKRWDSPRGPRGDSVAYLTPATTLFDPLVVVEGPMDALAVAGVGCAAVAILGANPPNVVHAHVAKLAHDWCTETPKVMLVPDRDAIKFWVKHQFSLGAFGVHANLQTLPGEYKDFAEIPREDRKAILEWLLTK